MVLPSPDETCPRLVHRTTDVQFHDFDLLEPGVELFFQRRQCRFARVRIRRKLEGVADEGSISAIGQTLQHDWSRNILTIMIHERRSCSARQSKAISNFADLLPPAQSDLIVQALKDPYVFDFLTLEELVETPRKINSAWRSVRREGQLDQLARANGKVSWQRHADEDAPFGQAGVAEVL